MRTTRQRLIAILLLLACSRGDSFAAKKKGNRSQPSNSNKGFGAPPLSLNEVVSKFRTRLPADPEQVKCACGSSETYALCCEPFHQKKKLCTRTIDVLRSRYSAFAYRLIRHIMETTHETCRDYRDDRIAWAKDLHREGMFDSYEFIGLDAGPEVAGADENEGYITFKVTLRAKGVGLDKLEGSETVVIEKSRFLRNPKTGVWSYASGEIRTEVAGLEDTVLNP